MRNGFDVILEDVEETLPSHLDSLISKHYIYEGIHTSVSLADSLIYVHPNFHLFISTKLSNPHYLPETAIKVCIVNFTVNINSLQEHLLADVFRLEEPDIEAQNLELIRNIVYDQKKLQEIEESILQSISETTGNILDDGKLINSLKNSKTISYEIVERMKESEKTKKIIDFSIEKYKKIAIRGSLIYFVIESLGFINPMYQFSLQYIVSVFKLTISEEKSLISIENRISLLVEKITSKLYSTICAGIFNEHHLLFGLMVSISIQKSDGLINPDL